MISKASLRTMIAAALLLVLYHISKKECQGHVDRSQLENHVMQAHTQVTRVKGANTDRVLGFRA